MTPASAAMRKKPISTWVVIRHFSSAKVAYVAVLCLVGTGNLAIFGLYKFGKGLFDQWVQFLNPAVLAMSKFLPTLRGFSEHIEKTWPSQDINLLKSSVAFDWLIYVPALIAIFTCIFVDFRTQGPTLSRKLWGELRSRDRPMSWPRLLGLAAMALVPIVLLYSGAEFGGIDEIYDPAFLFILSFIVVVGGIELPSLTCIYCLLLLVDPEGVGGHV